MDEFIYKIRSLASSSCRLLTSSLKGKSSALNTQTMNRSDKFYYFGYGSNMLSRRIQIQNPSSVRIGHGMVKNYRLDFNTYSKRWLGAPATIVPTPGAIVYGALWQIDMSNLPDIDNQEGVHEGHYESVNVPVTMPDCSVVQARAYTLCLQPETELNAFPFGGVPENRQPSKTYLQCMVKGAEESGIPKCYVDYLRSLQHNGKVVKQYEESLDLKDVDLNSCCAKMKECV